MTDIAANTLLGTPAVFHAPRVSEAAATAAASSTPVATHVQGETGMTPATSNPNTVRIAAGASTRAATSSTAESDGLALSARLTFWPPSGCPTAGLPALMRAGVAPQCLGVCERL